MWIPWWVKHWRQDDAASDEVSPSFIVEQTRVTEIASCERCEGTGCTGGTKKGFAEKKSRYVGSGSETVISYDRYDRVECCSECKGTGRVVKVSYSAKVEQRDECITYPVDEAIDAGIHPARSWHTTTTNCARYVFDYTDNELEKQFPELGEKNWREYKRVLDEITVMNKLSKHETEN